MKITFKIKEGKNMNTSSRNSQNYSISICAGGHETLTLGRVSLFLQIEELKAFLRAGQEILEEYFNENKTQKSPHMHLVHTH